MNEKELATQKCIPCADGVRPLKGEEIKKYLAQIEGWEVVDEHHLTKSYKFRDFLTGLDFVNKIGQIAEQEGHHPDIYLTWGKVRVDIWTHAINGLSVNDFILAAKFDKVQAS